MTELVKQPPVSMLRPALELAWAVAKVGSQARPPLPVPGRLRPIMRVARLPDRMLETVRHVVDDDPAFRDRVVAAAKEDLMSRPSWLWLVRPEGWAEELTGLVDDVAGAETEHREKRDAMAMARQLAEVTSTLQRVQAELVALKAVNEQLRDAAAEQHRQRRAVADEAAELRRQVADRHGDLEQMRSRHDELVARIASHEADLASASRTHEAGTEELAAVRLDLDLTLERLAQTESRARAAESEISRLLGSLQSAEKDARELAEGISASLGMDGGGVPADDAARAGELGGTDADPAGSSEGSIARPGDRRPRRRPVSLPPATFDDSAEAAAHLVRVRGVLLAVDGYNVTLKSWPGLELAEQRVKLVDSLAELAMRAGTEVFVVFDGVDQGNRLQPPAAVRGRLRVRFSPSEIEADDVIIRLVASVPVDRPVVVATNDRRVRDACAHQGANVISVDQLLAVVGRGARS